MTQAPRSPHLLARVLLLLVFLVSTGFWISQRDGSSKGFEAPTTGQRPAGGPNSSPAAENPAPPGAGPTKRSERRKTTDGSDRPNAPGNPLHDDLDKPIHAQARGVVPAGHAMVTGGYPLGNGRHEFALITPKWLESPDGSKQVEMEVELLNLDEPGLKSAGLETLVTAERKSEQNAEVWTPEEVSRTLKDMDSASLQSKPRVIVSPGFPARITVAGKDGAGFELELSATGTADGGFELSTDLKRIE